MKKVILDPNGVLEKDIMSMCEKVSTLRAFVS